MPLNESINCRLYLLLEGVVIPGGSRGIAANTAVHNSPTPKGSGPAKLPIQRKNKLSYDVYSLISLTAPETPRADVH